MGVLIIINAVLIPANAIITDYCQSLYQSVIIIDLAFSSKVDHKLLSLGSDFNFLVYFVNHLIDCQLKDELVFCGLKNVVVAYCPTVLMPS